MSEFDVAAIDRGTAYRLLTGAVVPRPIAFVSTLCTDGELNLAPFSYFNAVCTSPPILIVSIGRRAGQPKDTVRNILVRGEYVVNVVDEALAERANLASYEYPFGVSEFTMVGLTAASSRRVTPPRVAESPVSMECRFMQLVPLGDPSDGNDLIIGQVVYFHVRDDVLLDGRLHMGRLKPVARMGGDTYCRTGDQFVMPKPGAVRPG